MQASDKVIHVAGLPKGVTVDFLKTLFKEAGNVVSVTLKERPTGNFAFVAFDSPEGALLAQREYNYTKLNGTPIVITPTTEEYQNIIRSGEGNLYVRGLDENIEASQLHELFQTYGEVISVKLPLKDGKNRGFAYVQFRNPSDSVKACEELSSATINGKQITVEKYQKRGPPAASKNSNSQNMSNQFADETFTNVYIRNLPPSITNTQELGALFSDFGMVVSTKILADGQSGYCNMIDHESAVRAVNTLNGKVIEGKVLEVTRALSKEERMGLPVITPTAPAGFSSPSYGSSRPSQPGSSPTDSQYSSTNAYGSPSGSTDSTSGLSSAYSNQPANPYGANPTATSSTMSSAPINPYGNNPTATSSSAAAYGTAAPFGSSTTTTFGATSGYGSSPYSGGGYRGGFGYGASSPYGGSPFAGNVGTLGSSPYAQPTTASPFGQTSSSPFGQASSSASPFGGSPYGGSPFASTSFAPGYKPPTAGGYSGTSPYGASPYGAAPTSGPKYAAGNSPFGGSSFVGVGGKAFTYK